jgi:hypothetical protein
MDQFVAAPGGCGWMKAVPKGVLIAPQAVPWPTEMVVTGHGNAHFHGAKAIRSGALVPLKIKK